MSTTLTRRRQAATFVAAGIAAATMLSACSSSGSSTSASASGSSGSDVTAKAQQMVDQYSATTTTYPVPTTPVNGVAALKGRTVYYIPLVQQIPTFVVAANAMRTALAKAGLSLQVCDGQATPSAIASCVAQAVNANAAGIVTDAIPYGMAQNAFDAAKGKVPILIGDQVPDEGFTNTNEVAYVTGVTNMPSQVAWWMIADSKGTANAIFARETDNPSSTKFTDDALQVFKDNCPGCTVTPKDITASTPALLASQVSANIASTPAATYYYSAFEDSLQPTVQGIQQAGKTNSMSLAEAAGTIFGLGMLKSGPLMKAVVVVDEPYEGWALTDQILRMATKTGPVDVQIPSRMFTTANISSIQVTPAAQASGDWFGDSSYQSAFASLWGVS
jgi:ribose transport system substrate-binding protein